MLITFETNESVREVMDDVLQYFGVEHVSYLVPWAEWWNLRYFLRILNQHQPKLVITSLRHIGQQALAAVKAVHPQPAVWIFTGYDEETLLKQGALFLADRVFEKPWGVKRIGSEARQFFSPVSVGSS